MSYFLLFLGIMLIIITWKDTMKSLAAETDTYNYFLEKNLEATNTEKDNSLGDTIKVLAEKIDNLNDSFNDLLLQNIQDREIINALLKSINTSNKNLNMTIINNDALKAEMTNNLAKTAEEEKTNPQNFQIFLAFQEGKSINEIAKEFNKGKGEIELILNLFR